MGAIRRFWYQLVSATIVAVALTGPAGSQEPPPLEYQVKAAFLYNFAKFVTWPADAFPDAGSPFYVCVLGDDPFGPALDQTLEGETLRGRRLEIRRLRRPAGSLPCHILFVAKSEGPSFDAALARVDPNRTLTVGEAPRFLRAGGLINFVLDGNRVRFEINTAAARRSQLRISSKLMRLSRPASEERTGSP